jgi:hypothetical protein
MVEFSTEEKQVKIADLKVAKSLWPYIKPLFLDALHLNFPGFSGYSIRAIDAPFYPDGI